MEGLITQQVNDKENYKTSRLRMKTTGLRFLFIISSHELNCCVQFRNNYEMSVKCLLFLYVSSVFSQLHGSITIIIIIIIIIQIKCILMLAAK